MQTNAGPVCDVCGKYILPWEKMDVVTFPCCPQSLLGHKDCSLATSKLIRNWERGFKAMQHLGPDMTSKQRKRVEAFLVKVYTRHGYNTK